MKKLTYAGFDRARQFLLTEARPLERALFQLAFEDGSVDQVFSLLKAYQNPDGGFGQALEPDVRTPTSSALCTEMGLRYLAEHGAAVENPMVKAALKNLLGTFDPEAQVWCVLPTDANDHPHAPWWHDEDGSLARAFDNYLVIPRAGILASLHHFAIGVPADWLTVITKRTVRDILDLDPNRFGGGGDTLVYALRLADAPGLDDRFKTSLRPFLRQIADITVTRDPEAWSSYSTPPLKLAPTPDSSIADLMADDLQVYLDYLIDQQSPEGTWEPTWNWGGNYPADWTQAKQEWRGILTLDTLIALKAFDRFAA
jgi:hypothetical protein